MHLTFSIQDLAKENLKTQHVFSRLNVCSHYKVGGKKRKELGRLYITAPSHDTCHNNILFVSLFSSFVSWSLTRLLHQREGVIASFQIKEKERSMLHTICPSCHLTVTLTKQATYEKYTALERGNPWKSELLLRYGK